MYVWEVTAADEHKSSARLASIYNSLMLLHLYHEPKRSIMHTVLSVWKFVWFWWQQGWWRCHSCIYFFFSSPFAYLFIYLCRCSFYIVVSAFISFLSLLWVRFCLLLAHTMLNIVMYGALSSCTVAEHQARLLWQTVKANDLFFKSFTHHLEQFVQHFTVSVYA